MTKANPSIKDVWNTRAKEWAQQADNGDSYFTRRTHHISEFIVRTVPRCRSLDVGCGNGLLSENLLKAGYDAYACDLSEGMVEQARTRLAQIVEDANSRVCVSTPDHLPFDSNFGLVTAIGVFNYVCDYWLFLQTLSAKLKPGGFICSTCTNRFSLFSLNESVDSLRSGDRRTALNLIRTGIWSGGHVDLAKAKQCYSARAFDRLYCNFNFDRVAEFGMFNYRRLDRTPLSRNWLGKSLVRYLGWNYVAIYKKKL